MFTTHRDYSDITPTQYDAAYTWLRETGQLDQLRSSTPVPRRVFESSVAHSGAPWFPDADLLIQNPAELPDDALRAAAALGLSEDEAYEQLRASWGKVDAAERARIGAAGELALVELLSTSVDARVEHVAAWSDGYGYDIAVHAPRSSTHLEVKSTVRHGRLTVHISRNEYETMRRDRSWRLVAVRLTTELQPAAVSTVPREWITAQAPADQSTSGRWESFRLDVPPNLPEVGIPALAPLFHGGAAPLLTGAWA
jgi:hypothetical protein